ncbi:MAG: sulfatase [Clostridiales bacterium]|nr:sulfatase [Clostridiales bacterium]
MSKKPNVLFIGIDSLLRKHMSCYGYDRLTTPHMDKFAEGGVLFENCFSPSVPTTPGYSSMMSGRDCFGTNVVALRHVGDLAEDIKTLPEILRENGYNTTCIGFPGNVGSRGFDTYLNYDGWGAGNDGRAHKAEGLNEVCLPELERLAKADKPFLLFLRHMDPHSPYLPPAQFERMFYTGNECDPENDSLQKVYDFKPFCDYFREWFPAGCTDKDYIIAQYDGGVAYMDSCIQVIFDKLASLGIEEETIVVITSDHGETLYDHDCYFDHHGTYDNTLCVPLIFRWKGNIEGGKRFAEYVQLKDILPTLLSIMGIDSGLEFDGRDLTQLIKTGTIEEEPEFYITEATWMRKDGWRTPEWKLIRALEPDFHYKPEIELYNLIKDPEENHNVAEEEPEVVKFLMDRMLAHIAKREKETGRTNPMYTNLQWHGCGDEPFKSSDEAYNTLHIGDPEAARKLQGK